MAIELFIRRAKSYNGKYMVSIGAGDPDAPKDADAHIRAVKNKDGIILEWLGGTTDSLEFPTGPSITLAEIRRRIAVRLKNGKGDDIVGSSCKEKLVAWVKKHRNAPVKDGATLTTLAARAIESVNE